MSSWHLHPPLRELAPRLGMPEERIVVINSGMNKEDWVARAARFDRNAVREAWNILLDARVVFYFAKLQHRKRPLDLLRAFAEAAVPGAYLVCAGDGPQRAESNGKHGISE